MEIKGLSNESIEFVFKTDNTLTPSVNYYEEKVKLRFTGSVLKKKQELTFIKKFQIFMWSMKKPAIIKLVVIQHWKMRYLKLLNLKKTLTLTNENILVIELDLIDMKIFTS